MFKVARKALLCLVLCLALLAGSVSGAFGAENTLSAKSTFYSIVLKELISWDFEYSDSWFTADADAYSHPIARASLGMALSAFRNQVEDRSIHAYLTELGFTDLVSADYDKDTSIDTIATMIGHKQLPNGETLLAVAICGQGYKNEWLSNFDIGDQQEHKGFFSAAQKVVARVESYLQEHGLTHVRLWLNGYSRSAAVANLTGAELMKKGLFNEKNAYIYTFATPNTTKNPVPYANIFNVVGKFDPVASVPFAEWGFGRHGSTLYTPAQETDSDYRMRQQAADAPFYELTGLHLWNNPSINQHLAMIEAYLLSLVPSTADYDTHMSSHIATAWSKPDASAVLSVLKAMASIPPADGQESAAVRQARAEDLVDYIASTMVGVLAYDDTFTGLIESEQVAISVPIVTEHIPEVYLSWMFSSDDPGDVFSDKTQYVQLVVRGDADVNFFDQQGGFILSMAPDGTVLQTTENERYLKRIRPVEDRPMVTAMNAENHRIFVLPKDQAFPFTMIARSESDLQYYGIYYDIRQAAPTMSSVRLLHMTPGEEYLAVCLSPSGQKLANLEEPIIGDSHEIDTRFEVDQLLSTAQADQMAGLNPMRFSVREIVNTLLIVAAVVLIVVIILIVLLVLITRRIVRRCRKTSKKASPKTRGSVQKAQERESDSSAE